MTLKAICEGLGTKLREEFPAPLIIRADEDSRWPNIQVAKKHPHKPRDSTTVSLTIYYDHIEIMSVMMINDRTRFNFEPLIYHHRPDWYDEIVNTIRKYVP